MEVSNELCGAKKKSNGEPCRNLGLGTGGRCRLHGGASPPAGPFHPTWKHGRASQFTKNLPERLREAYETSVSDPDLMSLRSEIALLDSRTIELIHRLASGDGERVIEKIQTQAIMIMDESREDEIDCERIRVHADRIVELCSGRMQDDSTWADVKQTLEQRRKMSDTERRLAESKQAVVDATELRAIVTLILESIRENVLPLEGGREAVETIATDVRKLMVGTKR